MNTKHTPGPWYVGAQNDYLYIIDRAPRPSNDDQNHDADVEMVAKPFAARGSSLEANARLIAAAPELLEVAQGILADDMLQYLPPEYISKVRAVVAKAGGAA